MSELTPEEQVHQAFNELTCFGRALDQDAHALFRTEQELGARNPSTKVITYAYASTLVAMYAHDIYVAMTWAQSHGDSASLREWLAQRKEQAS